MRRKNLWLIVGAGCYVTSSACAVNYGFSDYYFVDPNTSWHVESKYTVMGSAEFKHPKYGKLNYAEGNAAVFYDHSFNEDNALSFEVEYDYLQLDWDKNPRFKQSNFNYVGGSVGFISTEIEKWRWILNTGFSVEANGFNFGKTGVYHGFVWGRYSFTEGAGINMGVLGWYGVMNNYILPVIGVDWGWGEEWKFNIIFPLNASITYTFNPSWSLYLSYSGFGGPYKYPRRASEGIGAYQDPIFKVFSSGLDLNINYEYARNFWASIGGGWNFGGWVLIKDANNHHGDYYKYNSAPYVQGSLAFSF